MKPKRNINFYTRAFHILVLLSVASLFLFKYVPSVDGPQHLYSANVIKQLVSSTDLVQRFFEFNEVIVGYWIGHFLLTMFLLLLPAFLAEKMVIIIYIVGIAYSFRYLVYSFSPKSNIVVFLIFPFSYSLYFLAGYYNFSLATILVFVLIGYLLRMQNSISFRNFLFLTVLFLLLYFSHAFVFVIGLFIIGLYLFLDYLMFVNTNHGKKYLQKFLFVLLSSLPAFILTLNYYWHVRSINDDIIMLNSASDLFFNVLYMRPLIGFDLDVEIYPIIGYWLAIMVLIISIISDLIHKKIQLKLNSQITKWFIVLLVMFLSYYYFPNKLSAGSLNNRVGLYMFFILVIWLSTFNYSKFVKLIFFIILISSFAFQRYTQIKSLKVLEKDIAAIEEVKDHIKPNSVLWPITYKSDIRHNHFLCYLGVDKSIINLGNPQAAGRFPIMWKYQELPRLFVGNKQVLVEGDQFDYNNFSDKYAIDYVAIFDYRLFSKNKESNRIISNLNELYELAKVSDSGACALFELKSLKNN
jgi:hypothetical protein